MTAQGWVIAIIIVAALLLAVKRSTRIAIIAAILIGVTVWGFNVAGAGTP